jgi:hypothetical protein
VPHIRLRALRNKTSAALPFWRLSTQIKRAPHGFRPAVLRKYSIPVGLVVTTGSGPIAMAP